MDIRKLTKGKKNCSCGRDHFCSIDVVDISTCVLKSLPEYVKEYHRILMVADRNTDRAAGSRIREILGAKVASYVILEDNGDHLVVPNEEKIAEIESCFRDHDLVFGVGSGVINDLCKYVSFEKDLPYYIFATAPSMDGYASSVAAMTLRGMKITTSARTPKAILADPEILKDAPLQMLQAGYGDIIGKFSSLNDWKLSALVNGEYLCREIWDLMHDTVLRVRSLAEGIRNRDAAAVGDLMEALVVSGILMAYAGNSRPASGAEHHLSHFFEITSMLDHRPYFCHGIDVAYSAVTIADLREKVRKAEPLFRPFRRENWETEIRRLYKTSAEGVMALQDKLGWHEQEDLDHIRAIWPEIRKVLSESPTRAETLKMLEDVGLSFDEYEALYGKRKIQDAIWYAKDLKDRYTVLWLMDQYAPEAGEPDYGQAKVVAMDLDGTLSQHKTPLPEANKAALKALSKRYHLLMVGAGMCRRVFEQMEHFPVDVLGTYGMQYCTYDPEAKDLRTEFDRVVPCDRESVKERVAALREKFGFTEYKGDSVEFHASGCVTFAILGTKAVPEEKLVFDPDRKKRRAILEEVKKAFPEFNVFIGGSSSFDMAPKPYTKAAALAEYASSRGLKHDEIVYIGDDYGPGGNDESVYLADFPYLTIDDYREFPNVVKCLLR